MMTSKDVSKNQQNVGASPERVQNIEYMLKRHRYPPHFEAMVNLAIRGGWKPQGGGFYDPDHNLYCQALIREIPGEAK